MKRFPFLTGFLVAATLTTATAALPSDTFPHVVRAKNSSGKWTEQPTRTLADIKGYAPVANAPALTAYGGWAAKKVDAPGFFRVRKIGDRWWMIDPAGCLYLSVGMNTVSVSGTPTAQANREKTFGSKAQWAEKTTSYLKQLGFNGATCWSDTATLNALPREKRIPYTLIWNFMSEYGKKRGGTYQQSGHIGYPHDAIFVFDPEFAPFCDEYAKKLTATKDDPYLIGHFSDNELPLRLNTLENFLSLPKDDPGYKATVAWLTGRKVAPEAITDKDKDDFRGYVADRYYKITTNAIRKYDPNHLCIGSRIHGAARKSEGVFRAAGKYLDVITVNDYDVWTPTPEYVGQFTKWSGRPILITEWYAKGEDSGMGNKGGAGWLVATQKDRALFYQNYTLGLLQAPNCVGWHWFKYADNDPTNTAADPSNRDSNKGIVNNRFQPYTPLVDSMRELNRNVYPLTEFLDKKNAP